MNKNLEQESEINDGTKRKHTKPTSFVRTSEKTSQIVESSFSKWTILLSLFAIIILYFILDYYKQNDNPNTATINDVMQKAVEQNVETSSFLTSPTSKSDLEDVNKIQNLLHTTQESSKDDDAAAKDGLVIAEDVSEISDTNIALNQAPQSISEEERELVTRETEVAQQDQLLSQDPLNSTKTDDLSKEDSVGDASTIKQIEIADQEPDSTELITMNQPTEETKIAEDTATEDTYVEISTNEDIISSANENFKQAMLTKIELYRIYLENANNLLIQLVNNNIYSQELKLLTLVPLPSSTDSLISDLTSYNEFLIRISDDKTADEKVSLGSDTVDRIVKVVKLSEEKEEMEKLKKTILLRFFQLTQLIYSVEFQNNFIR